MERIKIVADSAIPFLEGVFEPYAEVRYIAGNEIGPEDVRDADALMIRTRTRCNAALLEGSRVKFIATATIGTDHIDFPYCDAAGITVRNAPGCNAGAKTQETITPDCLFDLGGNVWNFNYKILRCRKRKCYKRICKSPTANLQVDFADATNQCCTNVRKYGYFFTTSAAIP